MNTHPATPGQKVIYHGSIEEARGEATYIGVCDADVLDPCAECAARDEEWEFWGSPAPAPIRYRLRLTATVELRCVRAESFSPIVADAVAAH